MRSSICHSSVALAVSNPTPKNKKGRLPGGLFCFGLVRNPNLFLVYSVNALTTFAWRPSRTAVSFAYSLAPIPPYLRNLTQVYSCWGERVLERDGLEGHRSRSELKKGSRLPSAPRKKAPLGTFSWSWRESNPRPNGETICFLQAYLYLDFRAMTWIELPGHDLIF